MISKYRNQGVFYLIIALAITAAFIFLLTRKRSLHTDDRWIAAGIFSYFGGWATWLAASYNFFKAKGYGPDAAGGYVMFLIVFSCFFPIVLFVVPAYVIFGLKDKSHRSRTRR